MDAARLRLAFRRLTAAGFPEVATVVDTGATLTGTVSSLRADVAVSLYGSGMGYQTSFLVEYSDALPGKDSVIRLRGKNWVILGIEVMQQISARLDLREGF